MKRKYATLAELGPLRDELRRAAESEAARQQAERARLDAQRALRERERNLFRDAVAGVAPIALSQRAPAHRDPCPPEPRQHLLDEQAALAESLSDEIDLELLLETDGDLSYRRAGVGPEVPRQLRRGHWTIRSQIDLHGHRVDEARSALAAFLDDCRRRELRCVRVIHGKGLGSANRQPVLKGKVMRWLVQRNEVLAYCQARPNDGGSGALLVLLSVR